MSQPESLSIRYDYQEDDSSQQSVDHDHLPPHGFVNVTLAAKAAPVLIVPSCHKRSRHK